MKATLLAPVLALVIADVALGSTFFLPKRGQTYDQLTADRLQCNDLATKQTGFDPMERFRATAAASSTETHRGGLFEGVKTREQRNREEQVRQDWEAKMAVYSRIVGVCMEERGYTVL